MLEPTSLQGIAKKAATDKTYRFKSLYGLITVNFLAWCWQFMNYKAAPGIDQETAKLFGLEFFKRAEILVEQLKNFNYRAKLVLRKYIPKGKDKLRPLGLPVIADKLLQMAVKKILEAIYEQDFLTSSYGYRMGLGTHDAIQALSSKLKSKQYHFVVEADIRSFFDKINHDKLLEMLS